MTRIKIAIIVSLALAGCPNTYSRVAPGLEYRKGCHHKAEVIRIFEAVVSAARETGMLKRWPPPEFNVAACVTATKELNCVGVTRPLAGCTYGVRVFVAGGNPQWKAVLVHELIAALANTGVLTLPNVIAETEGAWIARPDYRLLVKRAQAKVIK